MGLEFANVDATEPYITSADTTNSGFDPYRADLPVNGSSVPTPVQTGDTNTAGPLSGILKPVLATANDVLGLWGGAQRIDLQRQQMQSSNAIAATQAQTAAEVARQNAAAEIARAQAQTAIAQNQATAARNGSTSLVSVPIPSSVSLQSLLGLVALAVVASQLFKRGKK